MNRNTLARGTAVVVVLSLVLFWIWAFSPLAPRGNKDELSDRSFADPAEARCARSLAAVKALPDARKAATAADRADELMVANAELRAMVGDLKALPRGNANDQRVLGLWLADWDQYVVDREEYIPQLRADPKAAFAVTKRSSAQITRAIDSFANRNKMPSCAVPHDI